MLTIISHLRTGVDFTPAASGHKKRPPSCYTEWPLYLSLAKSYCLPIVIEWSWHSSPAPGVLQMLPTTDLPGKSVVLFSLCPEPEPLLYIPY